MAVERPLTTISLHTSRAAQIREIANRKGITVSELFGQWVNREIKDGNYADITPGVSIFEQHDGEKPIYLLSFGADETHQIEVVDWTLVRAVALMLQTAAKLDAAEVHAKVKGHSIALPGGHHLAVLRRGRGVLIEVRSPGKSTVLTLTPDLAMDVVRQFRTVIAVRH